MLQRISFLFLSVLMAASAFAQPDKPQPAKPGTPQVTFDLLWRAVDPQWYQISIDSAGRASYQSQPRTQPNETPGDPYMLKFTATAKVRDEVFQLTRDLNFFAEDLSYKGKEHIADTGAKTLSYTAEGRTTKSTFNWSPNPKAQELTTLFQRMSNCFELGRQLDYALRFDKLGVDQKLKELETLQRADPLPGLQVLEPTLQRILDDPETMNISRQRANYLLFAAKSEK